MNAEGLVWIVLLPILSGLLAWMPSPRAAAARALMPLGGCALALVMAGQVAYALWRTEVVRVTDAGVRWLAFPAGAGSSDPLNLPDMGFAVDPVVLAPTFAVLFIGLMLGARSASDASRGAATGALSVAVGGAVAVLLSRTGIGVMLGWWIAGWACRRLRTGSTGWHALSDAAVALATFAAFDGTGTWDLVAQRISAVGPLRAEAWGPLTHADVFVGAWVVGLGARVIGLTRATVPGDRVATVAALGVAATVPWVGLMIRLAPWIGSAPVVGATTITAALGFALFGAHRALIADDSGGVLDGVGRAAPALVVILVLSGGGFSSVELALVHALALPALAASLVARRRDLIALGAALTVAGVAPMSGHLANAQVLTWVRVHDSAWSTGINNFGTLVLALVLVLTAGAVVRSRERFCNADAPLDHESAPTRAVLVLVSLGMLFVMLPGDGSFGGPSRLALVLGIEAPYGPSALGEASRYFVGPRLDMIDSVGETGILPDEVRVAHLVAFVATVGAWVHAGAQVRTGHRPWPRLLQVLRPVMALARALGQVPSILGQALETAVQWVVVRGVARDGAKISRGVFDRITARLPLGLLRGRAPALVAAVVILLIVGWLYFKPSVATLGPAPTHGFGGLRPELQRVADPTRERKEASDAARAILEEAAGTQAAADPNPSTAETP